MQRLQEEKQKEIDQKTKQEEAHIPAATVLVNPSVVT